MNYSGIFLSLQAYNVPIMMWLGPAITFPDPETATEDGVLALGGDLSLERLLHAYATGIFPWYSVGEPIVWYCPPERMVLFPAELRISKSMQQFLRKTTFTITENTCFQAVVSTCKTIQRKDEDGTWITDAMEVAYNKLHQNGHAMSVEVWQDNELVGGLYGVKTGAVFCGESMFSKVSNASKMAFIHLVQQHPFTLIDCQVYNPHLESLGAREIDRAQFLQSLTS